MQMTPLSINTKMSEQAKFQAYIAVVRIQLIYELFIWGTVPRLRVKQIEQICVRTTRDALQILWFMRNKEILKGFKIISLTDIVVELGSKLQHSVVTFPSPSTSALVRLQLKMNDLDLRL